MQMDAFINDSLIFIHTYTEQCSVLKIVFYPPESVIVLFVTSLLPNSSYLHSQNVVKILLIKSLVTDTLYISFKRDVVFTHSVSIASRINIQHTPAAMTEEINPVYNV